MVAVASVGRGRVKLLVYKWNNEKVQGEGPRRKRRCHQENHTIKRANNRRVVTPLKKKEQKRRIRENSATTPGRKKERYYTKNEFADQRSETSQHKEQKQIRSIPGQSSKIYKQNKKKGEGVM